MCLDRTRANIIFKPQVNGRHRRHDPLGHAD
jgi:hypothetical protein